MKKQFVLFVLLVLLASCGSDNSAKSTEPITDEVKKEAKAVEDANVELEKIDGEIDSLMNTVE
jgi:peptidoglycan hydrolase CwlO-like protein